MMQPWLQRWQALSARERTVLGAGGAVVGLSLLFVLLIDPLLAKSDLLDRQIVKKQRELRELAATAEEYAAKRERLAGLEARMPSPDRPFSLLAFLEEASTQAQIRDRIASMQPQTPTVVQGYQETAVDIRFDGVQLPQLLSLLVAIEQAPFDVQVRHLQIKPKYDNPTSLDATLRILSYAKA